MAEFDQPLQLVTPHMTGQPVKDAQYLMAGNNRFKGLATYKDGAIDGDYGPITAAATKRTKYWLGYPIQSCDQVFGQTLYEYLRPQKWRPLPSDYQTRRAARLKTVTPGAKAIALARTFIGTKESPHGSNCQIFGADYGFNCVAWCAIFESYCFKHTGRPSYRYAACERIHADAAAGNNGLRLIKTPQQGDIVIYRIHGDPYAHTAFYDAKISSTEFWDLGGNTGPSDMSNGGEVLRQRRALSEVSFFVRVG